MFNKITKKKKKKQNFTGTRIDRFFKWNKGNMK